MKKKILTLCYFVAVIFLPQACTTSDDTPQPISIDIPMITKIESNEPHDHSILYIDDQLVITGTGFSADKSKDIVEIGYIDDEDTFNPFPAIEETSIIFNILSASETKLAVKANLSDDLDFDLINFGVNGNSIAMRVRVVDHTSKAIPVEMRRVFSILTQYQSVNTPYAVGTPIIIEGDYFSDNCTMTLYFTKCGETSFCTPNGPICDCDAWAPIYCGSAWKVEVDALGTKGDLLTITIPEDEFPVPNECNWSYSYETKLRLVNKDGKEAICYTWITYRSCL